MLLAEKYKYYEEMEAPIIQPPVQSPQQRPAPQPQHNLASKVISILMVMICFSGACLVVARYARISENHQQILRLKASLEKAYIEQDNLRVDLAFKEDLKNIEGKAKVSLGMNYPAQGQVQYVNLPETKGRYGEAQVIEKSAPGLLSRLLGLNE